MKELTKTPFVLAMLQKTVGNDVDTDALHVFEVRATSTVALRGKAGTVFEKAKISPNTIAQLAKSVNEDALPLMMDHDLRGTPFGKFFYAESIPMDNGETELRGYIYVDDSESKILAKLNAASIDEVSIQFKPEKLLCSECGFDYMAAGARDDYMPFIMLECDEGHKIGMNGVHTNLVGVQETVELSLVSRGAAKNSKIIAPSDAKLGQEAQRLAAHGIELSNFYCTASASDLGEEEVNFEVFMTQLSAANEAKQEAMIAKASAEAKVNTLEENIAGLNEQIATLKEELEGVRAELAAKEEPAATEEQIAALSTFVGKQYVAMKALDGETEVTIPQDLSVAMKFVEENSARLSALVPVGGLAAGAGTGTDGTEKDKLEQEALLRAQADAYRSN